MAEPKVKSDAPKITILDLHKEKCNPRRSEGTFRHILWSGAEPRKAPMHDGVWDKLIYKYPSLRLAFSWIAPTFWQYHPRDKEITCLQDKAFGATFACYKDGKEGNIVGQREVVEALAKKEDTTLLDIMAAQFSLASSNPLAQFQAMEKLVARNDEGLLAELNRIALSTDEMHVEARAYELWKTVSANAAAQLAAAAFTKATLLMVGGECQSVTVQELVSKGNKWEKIARRLVFGRDAVRYQDKKIGDPLWEQAKTSAFACAEKAPKDVLGAIRYFNVVRIHGEINAPTLALLASARTALASAMDDCRKRPGHCPSNKIRIRGKCRCPQGTKWIQSKMRCEPDDDGPPPCPSNKIRIRGKCQCPKGTKWIQSKMRCEPEDDGPPPCPGNKIRVGRECKCPSGLEWINNWCRKREKKCTGGRIRIGGRCRCRRGFEWIAKRCRKKCTGGKIRVGTRCQCPTGLTWIKGRCRKKSSGDGLGDSNVYK